MSDEIMGATLEREWRRYAERGLPANADSTERVRAQQAFYNGVKAAMGILGEEGLDKICCYSILEALDTVLDEDGLIRPEIIDAKE